MVSCQSFRFIAAAGFMSLILLSVGIVQADEIYLTNGDRLSGRIVSENEDKLVLEHDSIGSVTVNRSGR